MSAASDLTFSETIAKEGNLYRYSVEWNFGMSLPIVIIRAIQRSLNQSIRVFCQNGLKIV